MLGLGSSIVKGGAGAKTIVTDNLVLKHDYPRGKVHQVSTGAAFFDGTDDYIDVGDSDGIITGTNVTMACWFRLLDGDDTYLMTNKRTSGSSNLAIRVNLTSGGANDGHVSFVIWDGSSSHGDVSYDGNVDTSNKWHHVAVTTTSSAQKLYLDGVEVASGSNTFGNAASSDHMLLGNGPGSYFLKGYMCNAAVWNRVLTQAEVKSIMWKNYADLTSAETTSLSSWWNLDSTVGESTSTNTGNTRTSTFVLDNHGYSLGSEMAENFGFENKDTSYETASATYEYVSGNNGLAITTTGTGTEAINQTVSIPVSPAVVTTKKYLVSFDIVSTSTTTNAGIIISGGTPTIDKGAGADDPDTDHYWYPNTVGSHSCVVTFGSNATTKIKLHAGTAVGSVATFDNVSFKEITGNLGTLS